MSKHEIETRYTDEVVCPWCGHQHQDSYEFFQGQGPAEGLLCHRCEREFDAYRHFRVTYCTYRAKEASGD